MVVLLTVKGCTCMHTLSCPLTIASRISSCPRCVCQTDPGSRAVEYVAGMTLVLGERSYDPPVGDHPAIRWSFNGRTVHNNYEGQWTICQSQRQKKSRTTYPDSKAQFHSNYHHLGKYECHLQRERSHCRNRRRQRTQSLDHQQQVFRWQVQTAQDIIFLQRKEKTNGHRSQKMGKCQRKETGN